MNASELDTLHIWALEQLVELIGDRKPIGESEITTVNYESGQRMSLKKVIAQCKKIKSKRTSP